MQVRGAIKRVLEMGEAEKAERTRRNLEFARRVTTLTWASEVLHDLDHVSKSTDLKNYSAIGFGVGYRVMGVRSGFEELDMNDVCRSYRSARHRVILLDWGGTLVAEGEKEDKLQFYAVAQGHASRSGPTDTMKQLLAILCEDPKNTIFVVSGKELPAVSEAFEGVPGLGLGAEHGCFYRWPAESSATNSTKTDTGSPPGRALGSGSSSSSKQKWHSTVAIGDQTWKELTRKVMDVYVQRTHGTYVEQKGNAMIWQFRDADPEFGYLQSLELEENLSHILKNTYKNVDVLRGGGVSDGYIEVRPSGISKGLFLDHVVEELKTKGVEADFALVVGDDISDAPMFEHLEKLVAMAAGSLRGYSVTVGKKPSAAKAYIDDPNAVMELLTILHKSTARGLDLGGNAGGGGSVGDFFLMNTKDKEATVPVVKTSVSASADPRDAVRTDLSARIKRPRTRVVPLHLLTLCFQESMVSILPPNILTGNTSAGNLLQAQVSYSTFRCSVPSQSYSRSSIISFILCACSPSLYRT